MKYSLFPTMGSSDRMSALGEWFGDRLLSSFSSFASWLFIPPGVEHDREIKKAEQKVLIRLGLSYFLLSEPDI